MRRYIVVEIANQELSDQEATEALSDLLLSDSWDTDGEQFKVSDQPLPDPKYVTYHYGYRVYHV
jgi:hypothetical protein